MKLKIGQEARFTKKIVESDVYKFAEITEDYNPIHINDEEAKQSVFGKKIAHGMYGGGLISAVLGTKMPGAGTIYLEQNLKFLKPIFFEDTVTVQVTVSDIINENKGIYRIRTIVRNQDDEEVIDGYAVVKYK